MNRTVAVLGGATAAVVLAQVAPAATWLDQPTTWLLPRLKGVGRPDHVALTFDDGPDPQSTPRFLDALDRAGWTATFFLLGCQARRAPEVVDQILARGHEIGLHGDRHRSHLRSSPRTVAADLHDGFRTLERLTGTPPRWFRPPYGELSLGSVLAAGRLGLHPVLWTAWGRDWRAGETGASVAARVCRTVEPGGTILLHDSDVTSTPGSWRATLAALPLIAQRLGSSVRVGPLAEHF